MKYAKMENEKCQWKCQLLKPITEKNDWRRGDDKLTESTEIVHT